MATASSRSQRAKHAANVRWMRAGKSKQPAGPRVRVFNVRVDYADGGAPWRTQAAAPDRLALFGHVAGLVRLMQGNTGERREIQAITIEGE